MTVGRRDIKEDEERLLHQLSVEVGERYVGEVVFDPSEDRFGAYLRTSFPGLVRRMFARIVHTEDGDRFQLTPRGWMIGLKAGDFDASPDFAQPPAPVGDRIVLVVKTLKYLVDGRKGFVPAQVPVSDVEARCGVSRGWLRNSIESHMLQYAMPNKDVSCSYRHSDDVIVVPQTFQHPR